MDRLVPGLTAGIAALVLGTALLSQYAGGLAPCVLCLYQRIPYAAAIALGLAGLALSAGPARPRLHAALAAAAALVFLAGAGLAAYHVGVEQGWIAPPTACAAIGGGAASAADLLRQIQAAPVVRCDVPAWTLFGVSMAGYNLLVSLALAGAAGLAARHLARSHAEAG